MNWKEIIGILLPLLVLILRHFLSSRIDRKESLEQAARDQKTLDDKAALVLNTAIEKNRGVRRKVEELQDAMDADIHRQVGGL